MIQKKKVINMKKLKLRRDVNLINYISDRLIYLFWVIFQTLGFEKNNLIAEQLKCY